MYKDVLRSMENVEIFPIISLIIFILFFIGITIWAMRASKEYVDHMSALPMDDDNELTENQP
ncbi:Cbb3-type cytochrome oxidase component FixQ [Algoriphagus ratkowskyi]|uniref:Cbb3-type cytochrome oxidase component FixQ n=2 Tax=Algoriphagus ratkowskyi TaxID=57028 RepID=A0A2W7SK03_9BACT|nr:CcoQ/FixQ family Cbb3-type cytochrome c oxidase assembly chaperone [Algoriphagus ratkowskyi]PZX51052.1 Cbb3-type cytochrome oxidase component FixQ [Algoriphagus ratkowskyi]TXD75842.1 CcoQ/FixQ family Cbb3-type cytochrome c oxidase assembly chaperone [Algoriphagus ratkowskyi]